MPSHRPNDEAATIRAFLAAPPFAVVGASTQPAKFGGRVLAAYLRRGLRAHPVNPRETTILGQRCYATLADLPEAVENISIVTPPSVTLRIVEEAAAIGARRIWLQPGAESDAAIAKARALGLEVISGGACVLVELA